MIPHASAALCKAPYILSGQMGKLVTVTSNILLCAKLIIFRNYAMLPAV